MSTIMREVRRQQTHTAKVFIQQLHISVDDLQCDELIVLVLYGTAEIQTGVSAKRQQATKFNLTT